MNQIRSFFSQNIPILPAIALVVVGFFTVYIHRFFLRMIRYFLDIIIITNYRIVTLDKSLFLRDSKDAIDLAKIQDIEKVQNGIIRKVLKFGDLVITLSSSSTTKILQAMPRPDYHFRKINTLKRNYIKTRLKKYDRKTRIERIIEEVRGDDESVQTSTATEQAVTGLS